MILLLFAIRRWILLVILLIIMFAMPNSATTDSAIHIYPLDSNDELVAPMEITVGKSYKIVNDNDRDNNNCLRIWGRSHDPDWVRVGKVDGNEGEFHISHTWLATQNFELKVTTHNKAAGKCHRTAVGDSVFHLALTKKDSKSKVAPHHEEYGHETPSHQQGREESGQEKPQTSPSSPTTTANVFNSLFDVLQKDRGANTDDVPYWGWLLIGMGIAIVVGAVLGLIGWLCNCLCCCCCCGE